ncbi:unnamed protein product, partial [Laminaria digitata]
MVFTTTAATTSRFALFALGLAVVVAQHHDAVAQGGGESIQSCVDLATAIEDTLDVAASFELANDIRCEDYIVISSGQDITITGANRNNTTTTTTTTTIITVATDFAANGASQSVLDVQEGGTLTLDGIRFVQEQEDSTSKELQASSEGAVRAIYNMGTL